MRGVADNIGDQFSNCAIWQGLFKPVAWLIWKDAVFHGMVRVTPCRVLLAYSYWTVEVGFLGLKRLIQDLCIRFLYILW